MLEVKVILYNPRVVGLGVIDMREVLDEMGKLRLWEDTW